MRNLLLDKQGHLRMVAADEVLLEAFQSLFTVDAEPHVLDVLTH